MFQALQRLQSIFKNPQKTTTDIPLESRETPAYRVYTKKFDVVINADDLETVLGSLSDSEKIEHSRAWRTFSHALLDWRTRTTVTALDSTSRIRTMKTAEELGDTAITILVDQSGSMKGQSMLLTTAACDVAQDFLSHLGIVNEVLGFTTVRWKGGKSRQLWKSKGSRLSPGRLNDLLHIVYRSAQDERASAGGHLWSHMLRPDLPKENIDGEAIEWAVERLSASKAKQKTLIVLSDGAPVDDSTLFHNDKDILDRHLREVIGRLQEAGEIQLFGLGIGFDTARYYRNSHAIRSVDDLGTMLISVLENAVCRAAAPAANLTGPTDEGENGQEKK
jgi:cobaltochelatase CobT